MSTLWTPSGEHPVDPPRRDTPTGAAPSQPAGATSAPPPRVDDAELSPEDRARVEEYARQVEAARKQLLEAPAGVVVGQQALQFYELAALHLSQQQPQLEDARVAIDALAAVVERLGSRLGDAEVPLRQSLNQLQLAYVEAARPAATTPASDG
jgi:hypothetical protein